MSITINAARGAAFVAALALVGSALTPALARERNPNPTKVTVPASTFKDETSRLCMPWKAEGEKNAKTVCQTRADWEAQGLAITVK